MSHIPRPDGAPVILGPDWEDAVVAAAALTRGEARDFRRLVARTLAIRDRMAALDPIGARLAQGPVATGNDRRTAFARWQAERVAWTREQRALEQELPAVKRALAVLEAKIAPHLGVER